MGTKIHPVGFRVGITKPYQSQWFARFQKFQYSQTLLEDRLLRKTLFTLFPSLLNPNGNLAKKRIDSETLNPKITHIKIERGLIPYQITVQIHSQNSERLKAALEKLNVSKSLETHLLKVRHYLSLLQMKSKSSVMQVSLGSALHSQITSQAFFFGSATPKGGETPLLGASTLT
jgi:hypothetical protein